MLDDVSVSLAGFNSATLFCWTSPSIPIILSKNVDIDSVSYLTIIPPLAMILGSPMYSFLMNFWGRKYTIITMAFLHSTAWLIIALCESLHMLYVSKFIHGIGDACLFSTIPVYVGEISTAKVRSTWGNSIAVFIYFGQFSINAVGYFFDIRTTAFIFISTPILFFAIFLPMPETPYYYIMKSRTEEAKSSLCRLRGNRNIEEDFKRLEYDVRKQVSDSGSFKDLFCTKSHQRAMMICSLVRGVQQFGGISAFALYTQYIFDQMGKSIDRGYSAMIYTGMLAVSNLLGSLFINKLGTTSGMVLSCMGCTVTLFSEAVFFYFQEFTTANVSSITWFPVLGMMLYVLSYSLALGIVPTVIVGELFSANVKAKASCIMTVVFAVYIVISTKLFQVLSTNFGFYVPFTFFGFCTLLGAYLSKLFVPNTKGRSLEEIQNTLNH